MQPTRRSVLIALAFSSGSLAATPVSDGLLQDRVSRKLNNNPSLRIRDLKVEVTSGVVTIEGIIRSEKLKSRAAKMASMKGVKRVVNKLAVGN